MTIRWNIRDKNTGQVAVIDNPTSDRGRDELNHHIVHNTGLYDELNRKADEERAWRNHRRVAA